MDQYKFIIPDDCDDEDLVVYRELVNFIYHLAWNNNNPDNVMMQADDIAAELLVEVAKGMRCYGTLPKERRLAVIRKMIDNRMGELKHRNYVTHRKAAAGIASLEADAICEVCPSSDISPESAVLSQERVRQTRDKLSPLARQVLDAVILGDARLEVVMEMSMLRASQIFKRPKVKVKSHHVAVALRLSESQARKAWDEIRQAYFEVYNA